MLCRRGSPAAAVRCQCLRTNLSEALLNIVPQTEDVFSHLDFGYETYTYLYVGPCCLRSLFFCFGLFMGLYFLRDISKVWYACACHLMCVTYPFNDSLSALKPICVTSYETSLLYLKERIFNKVIKFCVNYFSGTMILLRPTLDKLALGTTSWKSFYSRYNNIRFYILRNVSTHKPLVNFFSQNAAMLLQALSIARLNNEDSSSVLSSDQI